MKNGADSAGEARDSVSAAALSDVGLRRANNQDSYAIAMAGDGTDWQCRGHLFMVADGMGAHAAGELASKMACESLPHTYRKQLDRPAEEALRGAVLTANSNIHERGQANAEFQGMGTTCSVLVLLPRVALVAHVGDSRVYRLRGEKLDQLTFDHSLVWEMRAAGQMPRGDIASFIPKNIITRSLGPHPEVVVDLEGPFPLEVGDVFLLCSDGLSGQVKDEEIGAVLSTLGPQEAVRILIDMANLRGGPDNITAVVARVDRVPERTADVAEISTIDRPGSRTPPFLWALLAVCVLAGLAFAMTAQWTAAAASGLIAAAVSVVALVLKLGRSSTIISSAAGGPLGTGPHDTHVATPNAESVAVLSQMAQQLREAAKDEHWTLDWARFNGYGDRAHAALDKRDYVTAVREYALAISFMMSEIRHQPARKDRRDSSVLDI